jgi:uncharacterized protein (DUF488 family)
MAPTIKLFTIGFTKKNAQQFFSLLQQGGVRKVLDTRLNNVSQLAGFTKRDDLSFFLREVAGIGYEHAEQLAPTGQMLKRYKKGEISWDTYAGEYQALIQKRRMESHFKPDDLDGICLLCSEATPHHCHRRLAAEFFQQQLGCGVDIIHL